MQGNVSMMLEDIDPFHRHNDYLKSIEVQIRSAANLTRQLLGFAREGRYNVKPVDMNEILETNVSMFERTKKEIRIHRDYEKDLWLVDADADQMGQVFINTFVNAWQAMPAGGDLQVETKNVILDEMHVRPHMLTPGRYVRVAVTDTGIGMDERTKQRIFEPFFTTKQRGQGTGLGLAMVYGIIKGHHGFINVYSEPGRGSTFNIYLPVSQKEVSPEAPENQEIVRGTGTILLVDDEAQVLKASQRMLEHLGYTVIPAQGGKEAINLYEGKKEGIDLVLLDLVMPDMSGKKVFQHLRHVNPEIKVILLSGYSKNETTQEILESGARGFLQKPASLKELSQKIHEVLRAGNGSDPQGKIH
jgi:CheY-like chemotaxis protein